MSRSFQCAEMAKLSEEIAKKVVKITNGKIILLIYETIPTDVIL